MLDFILCASTNLFRIFLIDRFVSVFLGKEEDKRNGRIFVCVCFFIINTALFWEFHTVWVNVICNLVGISAIVGLFGYRDIGILWCGNAQVGNEDVPDYLNVLFNRLNKTAAIKEIAETIKDECDERVQGETIRCHIAGYENGL